MQNLEAWEEAKKEVDSIPDHPNKLPPVSASGNTTEEASATPSGTNRRDSVATVNGR